MRYFKYIMILLWVLPRKLIGHECPPASKNFFYKRFTTKYFDWHFGYLPKDNKREGRLVYFSEYIKYAI